MKADLKQIQELMKALAKHDFHEIELQEGETSLRLRRHLPKQIVGSPQVAATQVLPAAAAPSANQTQEAPKAQDDGDFIFITSPFVGTFYRSPSPSSDPFVDIGQQIKPGQTMCIVEAMKLMNEIESEVSGKLVEVLVESGKPVEFGDRLFKLDPR